VDLLSDGDEVGGELFGGFRGETGSAAAGTVSLSVLKRGIGIAYDLQ
jgi:hypothetical protein